MKLVVFLFILLSTISCGYAQKNDSVVQYKLIESGFTDKSKLTTDKKHYEYTMIRMRAGDEALIEYTSTDFVEAIMVRDSLGNEGTKEDDSTLFKAIGSKIILPFKAPADGPYYFVFMTKDHYKTGKFKAHIFHFNTRNNHITTASTFCDKLKYITGNSYTSFEFLKDKEEQGTVNSYFTTTVNLLPGATSFITHDMGDSYTATLPASKDLVLMKKKFDELEHSITACLADHKKKIYTMDEMTSVEKKTFVRKVEFTLNGSYAKDLNATHALNGLRDKVILQLDKDTKDGYRLKIEVD